MEVNIFYSEPMTILASICSVLFCVLGVTGNLITIVALIRCPKLRIHATTAFIISLSISDFIFCAINMPLTASRYIQREWTLGDGLCKLFPVLFYGNVAVSVLNMVAITINRYIIITHNSVYAKFYTKRSIFIQLFAIWAISFLIMLPPLLGVWGTLGQNNSTFSCTILEKDGSSPKKMIFLVGFFLPVCIITVCYAAIYYNVRKSRLKLAVHRVTVDDKRSRKRDRDDRRLTNLMFIIFISFVLCFLPLTFVNVFETTIDIPPAVHVISSILEWMSSVINPLIYAVSNRQYREAYGKLFNLIKTKMPYTESRNSRPYTESKQNSRPSVSEPLKPPIIKTIPI